MFNRTRFLSLPATVFLVLAGCGRSDTGASGAPGYATATVADSAITLGPGDLLIRTTDGSVDLALVRDTVWMKLSDSVLKRVHADLDTAGDAHGSAFGAKIANMVKGTVGSALNTRIEIPVADIDDVRYEDGAIKFAFRSDARPTMVLFGKRRPVSFDGSHFSVKSSRHKPVLESFSPEDAQRFVAAVHAAKGRK